MGNTRSLYFELFFSFNILASPQSMQNLTTNFKTYTPSENLRIEMVYTTALIAFSLLNSVFGFCYWSKVTQSTAVLIFSSIVLLVLVCHVAFAHIPLSRFFIRGQSPFISLLSIFSLLSHLLHDLFFLPRNVTAYVLKKWIVLLESIDMNIFVYLFISIKK